MKYYPALFLIPGLFCLSAAAWSSPVSPLESKELSVRITAKLNAPLKNRASNNIVQKVTILTPPAQLAKLCAKPEIALPATTRLAGKRSVSLQCGNRRHFIQIAVEAEGTYLVTRRALKKGHILTDSDFHPRRGSLENLPDGLLFAGTQVSGSVTTRALPAGQPLLENLLRKHWRVTNGQKVTVITAGPGFFIRANGKALDNAAVNQPLRVRLQSGKITSGRVNGNGEVVINPEN